MREIVLQSKMITSVMAEFNDKLINGLEQHVLLTEQETCQ